MENLPAIYQREESQSGQLPPLARRRARGDDAGTRRRASARWAAICIRATAPGRGSTSSRAGWACRGTTRSASSRSAGSCARRGAGERARHAGRARDAARSLVPGSAATLPRHRCDGGLRLCDGRRRRPAPAARCRRCSADTRAGAPSSTRGAVLGDMRLPCAGHGRRRMAAGGPHPRRHRRHRRRSATRGPRGSRADRRDGAARPRGVEPALGRRAGAAGRSPRRHVDARRPARAAPGHRRDHGRGAIARAAACALSASGPTIGTRLR